MNRFFIPILIGALLAPGLAEGRSTDARVDPAIRLLLARPAVETAGLLRAAAAGEASPPIPRGLLAALIPGSSLRFEIFVETTDPGAVFGDTGAEVIPLGADLYASRMTLAELRSVTANLGSGAVRLARPLRHALDRSGPYLRLEGVRRFDALTESFTGYTGKSVVVGIVDGGVDWSHPDFQDAAGLTRLAWYWDQTQPFGASPPGYPFGQEYSAALIDVSLRGGFDPTGHGTHVAGIAAGNGRASITPEGGARYAGVAPEATLIAVRSNLTEFGVAVGVQYVMEKAMALGLPAVVNLSLGNSYGPHVGDTPLERSLLDDIAPGRLIVAAAGNDGARDLHAEISLAAGETAVLPFEYPIYEKDPSVFSFLDVEGWFDPDNRYRFTLRDPEDRVMGIYEWGDLGKETSGLRGVVRGWNTHDQGWGSLLLEVEDNAESRRRATGIWTLQIEALEVPGDPEIDFWLVNWKNGGDYPRFLDHVDRRETLLIPATAPRILAVGALSTRACWTQSNGEPLCYDAPPQNGSIAPFSGMGPTKDGRDKPEIYAPGYGVVSARSTTISSQIWTEEELAALGTPDGRYLMLQGTSMAAPQVTGAVALLLARFPEMTYEQMAERIRIRSREGLDARTGEAVWFLDGENTVAPVADVTLSWLVESEEGIRLQWFVGKARGSGRYRVYKGFSDEGPFFLLSEQPVFGGNSFETLDGSPESGRNQVYRIAVRDEAGLEEDLDTLRVAVPGTARFVFRAPDPNPAREAVSLRFFLPPSPAGGRFQIDAFDIAGRRVAEVERGDFGPAGEERSCRWDLTRAAGGTVAGGVYFLRAVCEFAASPEAAAAPPGPRTIVRRVVTLP